MSRDHEKEVYCLLVFLRCKPFLEPYVADLRRLATMGPDTAFPLGVTGFHTLYLSMDFKYAPGTILKAFILFFWLLSIRMLSILQSACITTLVE